MINSFSVLTKIKNYFISFRFSEVYSDDGLKATLLHPWFKNTLYFRENPTTKHRLILELAAELDISNENASSNYNNEQFLVIF